MEHVKILLTFIFINLTGYIKIRRKSVTYFYNFLLKQDIRHELVIVTPFETVGMEFNG